MAGRVIVLFGALLAREDHEAPSRSNRREISNGVVNSSVIAVTGMCVAGS